MAHSCDALYGLPHFSPHENHPYLAKTQSNRPVRIALPSSGLGASLLPVVISSVLPCKAGILCILSLAAPMGGEPT